MSKMSLRTLGRSQIAAKFEDPLKRKKYLPKDTLNSEGAKLRIANEKYVTMTETHIEWSNLIFLPFHPVFRMFILSSVFIKATLGPIQAVFPIVYCNDLMDHHPLSIFIKYSYWYICDFLYGMDTFLHIVHRQVVDKAMRREYLPKSAIFLTLDLLSLIPFYRLVDPNPCPTAKLWPNILAFNEFLVIYRVTQYFSLMTTHSYLKQVIGYTIVLGMCLNCIACLWLLITKEGFCNRCREPNIYYDWRSYVMHRFNETDEGYATYVYGAVFILSLVINHRFDETKPSTFLEFKMICIFMIAAYVLARFVVMPKCVSEAMLRLRRICLAFPYINKIIEDTGRRNRLGPYPKQVKSFYKIIWRNRAGIINTPELFSQILPNYLRLEIKQDLLWPLYHHSPLLRKTSYSFQRWLNDKVVVIFKLPDEKFYTSTDDKTNLYYIKSGIVQLISVDDGVTPILSVTSGTVFGDINFLVPHINRKVLVRCITYCEIFYVTRRQMLEGLHKYPMDQKVILEAARDRIDHARSLYFYKQQIKGLDRNEDEGIAWLKKRWWEIFDIVNNWTKKKNRTSEDSSKYIPQEEYVYHCPKYIGQLVLCTITQLQTKSMFTRYKFPWILSPHSKFGFVWHRIVVIDVLLVLMLYPPNLIKPQLPQSFVLFTFWSDTIYALDIGVSLFTAVIIDDNVTVEFHEVMFERFKSITFLLDLISTIWIEELATLVGVPEYRSTFQFNRLIKIYKLYHGKYLEYEIQSNPFLRVCRNILLINLGYTIIASHAVLTLSHYKPQLSLKYFFGEELCSNTMKTNCSKIDPFAGVTICWTFESIFAEYMPLSLLDIYVALVSTYSAYLLSNYCKGLFIAYLYLKNMSKTKYQNFVSHLKTYYRHYNIHPDLLKRLDRYLTCHWKYYHGADVMNPTSLYHEPREVYWRAQGHIAEKIISETMAFKHADISLVRKLGSAGKFMLLPRNTVIISFGVFCRNVSWIVQGCVMSEYHDESGEPLTEYYRSGRMLSVSSVFFGKVSLRTFTAYSEVELLYIPVKEFFDIYNNYPIEKYYLDTCINEFGEQFDDMFFKYLVIHREGNVKDREKRESKLALMQAPEYERYRSMPFEGQLWGQPESQFMKSWILFRTIIVCVSIISASILGGVGASKRRLFMIISAFCDSIAWMDIIIKLFLAYHNDRGLLITDKKKCLWNYVTKGFVLDLIGSMPWHEVFKDLMSKDIDDGDCFLINTFCKFAHIYILFAYFDYITDAPSSKLTYMTLLKWQIVYILVVLGCSHFLMVNCVDYEFNDNLELINVIHLNHCWMPKFFRFPNKLTAQDLHLIFAQSLNLAESGMMRMNFGRFEINRDRIGVGTIIFMLSILFWFITCYTLTTLVLNGHGDTVFQHAVYRLHRFLKSERVESDTAYRVVDYFRYCWIRNKGENIQQLANERIGVVFRQDLSFYFYKKTFTILDSLLNGGDKIQRRLASNCTQLFYQPDYDIFREMELVETVYIVHRGKVAIYKNGRKLMILTKGDIFGQLVGTKLRPIRVTATAQDHVDLLLIDVPVFQSIISQEVRDRIQRNRQTKNEFIATRNVFIENPFDTVKYLLRGPKIIQLPWNDYPKEARFGTWYANWLHLVWFINPMASAFLAIMFTVLSKQSSYWIKFYAALFVTDAIHFAYCVSEFFTVQLTVVNEKVVPVRLGFAILKHWAIYVDMASLVIPLITFFTQKYYYHLARLLRLTLLFYFEYHFCRTFKTRATPILLKMGIMLLMLHCFTCGWIIFGCRYDVLPIANPDLSGMNTTIDFTEWMLNTGRPNQAGCCRTTRDVPDAFGGISPGFVVPITPENDYVIAMTYILLIQTQTTIDTVIALSLSQVYFKVIVTYFSYLLDIWIMAVAVNYFFAKYRELYQYDYLVQELILYLNHCGICQSLKDNVLKYTQQLWNRQKGDWLPELAYQAPPVLRSEIFSALYMHHLDAPQSLRGLPQYFKRQMVSRLRRTVIFPGNCIVREGDVHNVIYFIHEGEVEIWLNNSSGEGQLLSVLYTNGYFGIVCGLIKNAAFQYSYFSRTVVDLVYLELSNWEDLLLAYPEVRETIMTYTLELQKEILEQKRLGMTLHAPHVDVTSFDEVRRRILAQGFREPYGMHVNACVALESSFYYASLML